MPFKIAMLSAMSRASRAPFEEIANEEKSFSWSPTVVEWVMKKFISNHLFQIPQIAMQKNELHYRQCKQEFWQLTNSLKKNALTELFRKEREEDFDSRESLELPAKSVSFVIYKTEFLKMSLIIINDSGMSSANWVLLNLTKSWS